MRKKQVQELHAKTAEELKKLATDLEREIKKLKTEQVLGNVKNLNEIKNKMKDKARILTIMKGASK